MLTDKEKKKINDNLMSFRGYCSRTKGYVPPEDSPDWDRLARAWIGYTSFKELNNGKRFV